MKKLGDLMKELGFREDGSESVKKAFVENLRRVLEQQEAGRPPVRAREAVAVSAKCPVVKTAFQDAAANPPEQLSLFETPETSRRRPRRSRAG